MVFHAVLPARGAGSSIGVDGSESASSLSVSSLTDPRVLQIWFEVLTDVLERNIYKADMGLGSKGQLDILDEWNYWIWQKSKKWYAQIMSRLFSRYGIPSNAEYEVKECDMHFSKNAVPQFLGLVLKTIFIRP